MKRLNSPDGMHKFFLWRMIHSQALVASLAAAVLALFLMIPSQGLLAAPNTGTGGPQMKANWTDSWFGWYYPDGVWLRSTEHGWLYPSGGVSPEMWVYDLSLGRWVYFSSSLYSLLYIDGDEGGWVIYATGAAAGSRYFYSYNREGWFIESELIKPSEMVKVEGATFSMQDYWSDTGLPRGDPRSTTLSPYRIGRTEVTHALWKKVRGWAVDNGYEVLGSTVGKGCADDHPVVNVNWYDAVKWCNARSEMEGLTPVYYMDAGHANVYRTGEQNLPSAHVKWEANGYRLPTEAEWEFAARGGDGLSKFLYSGSDDLDTVAWHASNSEGAACNLGFSRGSFPVGGKQPNALGLYDMSGNVGEWCWDNPGLYLESLTGANPKGPANITSYDMGSRIMRGGHFNSLAEECEGLYRRDHSARLRQNQFGFRLARSIP